MITARAFAGFLTILCLASLASCGPSATEHYQAALSAHQEGDPEKALKHFESAGDYGDAKQRVAMLQLTLFPLRQSYDQAREAIDAKELPRAEGILNGIVTTTPRFRDVQQLHDKITGELDKIDMQAESLLRSGQLSEAAQQFNKLGTYKGGNNRARTLDAAIISLDRAYDDIQRAMASSDWATAWATLSGVPAKYPQYEQYASYKASVSGKLDELSSQSDQLFKEQKFKAALDVAKRLGSYNDAQSRRNRIEVEIAQSYSNVIIETDKADYRPGEGIYVPVTITNNNVEHYRVIGSVSADVRFPDVRDPGDMTGAFCVIFCQYFNELDANPVSRFEIMVPGGTRLSVPMLLQSKFNSGVYNQAYNDSILTGKRAEITNIKLIVERVE